MEISLINTNVSYKRVTSVWISELFLCPLFLKNNQPKMILCQRHIWGGKFCSLSRRTENSVVAKLTKDLKYHLLLQSLKNTKPV